MSRLTPEQKEANAEKRKQHARRHKERARAYEKRNVELRAGWITTHEKEQAVNVALQDAIRERAKMRESFQKAIDAIVEQRRIQDEVAQARIETINDEKRRLFHLRTEQEKSVETQLHQEFPDMEEIHARYNAAAWKDPEGE